MSWSRSNSAWTVVVAVNYHIITHVILLYHPSVWLYDHTVHNQAIWFLQELLYVLHSVSS